MTVLMTWVAYIVAILLGVVGHEAAHWIVWVLAGRRPKLGFTSVQPRQGPPTTTPADRVAAAAPYLIGASAAVVGVITWDILWLGFALGLIRVPSRVDMATMRGRVEWELNQTID